MRPHAAAAMTLYVECVGDAPGPPVLLLHGLGSSSRDWGSQRVAFAAAHRLIIPDLPGHGRSPRPPGGLSIEPMAAEVERLLGRLGAPAVHVVGLSLGACVGLTLSLRAPDRVRSLTLVNAFARLRPAGLTGAGRMAARLGLLLAAPMPVVAAHVARGLFPKPEQRALYEAAVTSLGTNSRGAYLAAVAALRRFDARDQLGQVRCPTLVVSGDRDRTVPFTAKRELAGAIPNARLVVIEDSGHASNHDQAERFNRIVLEFLTTH